MKNGVSAIGMSVNNQNPKWYQLKMLSIFGGEISLTDFWFWDHNDASTLLDILTSSDRVFFYRNRWTFPCRFQRFLIVIAKISIIALKFHLTLCCDHLFFHFCFSDDLEKDFGSASGWNCVRPFHQRTDSHDGSLIFYMITDFSQGQ